jgi:aerobic-type carbon monoxide dehydrogenase small subunit (CoxS/CutS family)
MLQYTGKSVIELRVNGEIRNVIVRPADILLDVLREQLGLTGAKPGCKNGDCGACTVLIDQWPTKSCMILAVEAVGHEIMTIEGLKDSPLQAAFVEQAAFQCGYCTSGFLMVCHGLYLQHPDANELEIEDWLQANLCRCTSYQEIRQALKAVFPNAYKPTNAQVNQPNTI